ncbi:NAD(P)/FAD-dependent oxidoreductase [Thioalkalivibrio sp. HK1]|uniref:NAD(P)/FAD-dependent oxidoreductase n=1 Tax=Thioalkalivibrio sp. HK1 TaxID=1469245 RepID=UPI00046F2438|nr:FAD-dependent oxidoreductase [Thioalkalivibrio sp. HK1]
MPETTIIAGAGQAGGQTAISLRQAGYEGKIILCGAEGLPPYQRPPLSKKYLGGELERARLFLRPQSFYETQEIDLRPDSEVLAVDRAARKVTLEGGEVLSYDHLVLATGSRPRSLTIPGSELADIFYLRTLLDVDAIRGRMEAGRQLVVVGGGYIGLEVAATAKQAGLDVCVLEAAPRLLGRVTAPEMSEYYLEAHRSRGVDVRVHAAVSAFSGNHAIEVVECKGSDGLDERIPADMAVVGIGVSPATDLAEKAGLSCDDGISVDEHCRTSDAHIYAVGDCTRHPNPILGRRLRLESVQNAIEQAKTAAANIVGNPLRYEQIPWFWSDQFDLKLQMAGISEGYDAVVQRGSMEADDFALFYLREGLLIAVDAVNRPREFMACRKLLPERARIEPSRLEDESIPMQEMI